MPFARLFEPIRIGRAEIRNRIVLTGHGTGMGRDFAFDECMVVYYKKHTKNKIKLIILNSQ